VATWRVISHLVVERKTFVEESLEEVALLHSRIVVGVAVHRLPAEVVPLTVQGVPRSLFEL